MSDDELTEDQKLEIIEELLADKTITSIKVIPNNVYDLKILQLC